MLWVLSEAIGALALVPVGILLNRTICCATATAIASETLATLAVTLA
jgi:integral membrane sensor domain MASE1